MIKKWLIIFALICSSASLWAFDGYIDITNNTGFTIYYVYISPQDADSWGEDLMDKDAVLEDGETLRFSVSDEHTSIFDIKIEDTDGDYYTMEAVDLATVTEAVFTPMEMNQEPNELLSEVTIIGDGGPITGTYLIYNECGRDIVYIYIKKAEDDEWSKDILGENNILTNKGVFQIKIRALSAEIIDLKLEDKKGDTYTYQDIDLNTIKELTVRKEDRE